MSPQREGKFSLPIFGLNVYRSYSCFYYNNYPKTSLKYHALNLRTGDLTHIIFMRTFRMNISP